MAQPKAAKPTSPRPVTTRSAPPAAQPARVVATPRPAAVRPVAKTPPPPARAQQAKPKLTSARSTPPPVEKSLFDMKTIGGGLAVLALLGLVGLVVMRRRASYEVMDAGEFASDPLAADNPFAELGDDLAVGGSTEPGTPASALVDTPDSALPDTPDSTPVQASGVETGEDASSSLQEDLFGAPAAEAETGPIPQESGTGGETMESMSETPASPMMDGAAAAMAGGGGEEVMSMLRAFEQRIAGLESRLDEVSEAKERLERQVAAQTEELRVQRAAIARTQRAVRNLNRPEDEAPTEPALRDPARPGGPRTDV
jgi:hypothetical protein